MITRVTSLSFFSLLSNKGLIYLLFLYHLHLLFNPYLLKGPLVHLYPFFLLSIYHFFLEVQFVQFFLSILLIYYNYLFSQFFLLVLYFLKYLEVLLDLIFPKKLMLYELISYYLYSIKYIISNSYYCSKNIILFFHCFLSIESSNFDKTIYLPVHQLVHLVL